jgi:hypothetical protein
MKYAFGGAVILALSGAAYAGNGPKLRFADAAAACLVNCSNENESCKRVCPTTFNVPCLTACDNQAQACRQNCQRK